MKEIKSFFTLFFFLILFSHLNGQSITDTELTNLAMNLTQKIKSQMVGQNIAIADFVDMNDKPSDLGKYLAEEFSYTLVEKANNFNVIDRSKLRQLLKEAEIGESGMIDPQSIQKIDRLEGITAVVYGKLIPVGNYIKIYVKVVILEKQINVITVRGNLTRTPTIEVLLGKEKEKRNSNLLNESFLPVNTKAVFTNNHIQIAIKGCIRRGAYLDCEIQITSIRRGDNFTIKKAKTRLIDLNGRTYTPYQLNMNGKQSQVQLNQPLRANTPVSAIIRFANIPGSINTFSAIEIDCNSSATYSFIAQIQNIIIQN